MRVAGWVLVVLGFALGAFALEFFPTYVIGPDGTIDEVDNPGLMFDRLGLIVISATMFLGGLILAAAGAVVAAVKRRG